MTALKVLKLLKLLNVTCDSSFCHQVVDADTQRALYLFVGLQSSDKIVDILYIWQFNFVKMNVAKGI